MIRGAQYGAMARYRVIPLLLLALAASLLSPSDAAAQQTLRYTIISNGKTEGSEVDTYGPDGHIDSTFEFNDRGRGPKIEAHYIVARDGWPRSLNSNVESMCPSGP